VPEFQTKTTRYFASYLLVVLDEMIDGSVLTSFNDVSHVSTGPQYSYANSDVCEVSSVKNSTIHIWLNDGVY